MYHILSVQIIADVMINAMKNLQHARELIEDKMLETANRLVEVHLFEESAAEDHSQDVVLGSHARLLHEVCQRSDDSVEESKDSIRVAPCRFILSLITLVFVRVQKNDNVRLIY